MTMVTRMLVEDFLRSEFPRGTQLINGEVVMHDPTLLHQRVVRKILVALSNWSDSPLGRGEAGIGGNWQFGPDTSLIPDLWWVDSAQSAVMQGLIHDRPPVIAVEVRSPSTWAYDTGPKLRYYESAGVAEVWLVDTMSHTILVHRRSVASLQFDDSFELFDGDITTPILPGFAVTLASIFSGPDGVGSR